MRPERPFGHGSRRREHHVAVHDAAAVVVLAAAVVHPRLPPLADRAVEEVEALPRCRPADPTQCSITTHPLSSSVIVLRADGPPAGGDPFGRTSQSPTQKSNSRKRGVVRHGCATASKASSTAGQSLWFTRLANFTFPSSVPGGRKSPIRRPRDGARRSPSRASSAPRTPRPAGRPRSARGCRAARLSGDTASHPSRGRAR